MTAWSTLSTEQLSALRERLRADFARLTSNRLSLDLTRGKPGAAQLDLSNGIDDTINGDYRSREGIDVRNYGGLRGLVEARELGSEIMDVPATNILVSGNSSLSLMYLAMETALRNGLSQGMTPWQKSGRVRVLTPVPGYDRHFALTAALGVEMLNVALTDTGPDMQAVQELVRTDSSIKGIWCVPKYANPTGCIYSDETVRQIAELPHIAAAEDFIVFWDNAYAVHDLEFPPLKLASLFEAAQIAGTQDHIVQFGSTSKITFAGAGIAFVGSAESVLARLEERISVMTVGPDKLNQLRHARFLLGRVTEHMQGHAQILKPKFTMVADKLESALGGLGIASWTNPRGGYFVSLDVMPGLAKRVVALAKEAGLAMTAAGATFPYGLDPEDRNIRIAPTFAEPDALEAAMDVLTLCVKIATIESMIDQ
ncbi:MAG: aminotransferase class I/II-fold pyridoxal phosphate-dependent enzyme [Pseudomonadales bacterium]|nr:aminotransferase class I/II-fold pyridoxal phosphate-dependent enzyme [Pseudomonadales bacterium]MCP5184521.1 aminotransferase class I/II-fold pyridoxal phosphate-dependent enzyme [Pseudomonadales bacterium]